MSGSNQGMMDKQAEYRKMVNEMGKKEFTLKKMQEYGFWPKDLPTPYEIQRNETEEEYAKKRALLSEYEKVIDEINELIEEQSQIDQRILQLKRKYDQTWDYEKIRAEIAKEIMEESIKRRKQRKEQKKQEKEQRHAAWLSKKENNIIFIGKGYSTLLHDTVSDEERLVKNNMPVIKTDKELAEFLGLTYKELRFLVYHRDVITVDHYHRYTVPKKKGGMRMIAAPKPKLKAVQRKILEDILNKVTPSENAHGFLQGKSVVSGAQAHIRSPKLLINMDIQDFFPTITFERVRGMFKDFGYSGYIASLLAMVCTYCERVPIEIKGQTRYVKVSDRILPQGAPSSPMITNIICRKLDHRLSGLANKLGCVYTRYADDMSFTFSDVDHIKPGKVCALIAKIVREEGFRINTKKTRFLRTNNRQAVTGVIINNETLGVKKEWVKKLRAAIYNANRLMEKGQFPEKKTIHEISGMAAWLKSVSQERYQNIIQSAAHIMEKYNALKKQQEEKLKVEQTQETPLQAAISQEITLQKAPEQTPPLQEETSKESDLQIMPVQSSSLPAITAKESALPAVPEQGKTLPAVAVQESATQTTSMNEPASQELAMTTSSMQSSALQIAPEQEAPMQESILQEPVLQVTPGKGLTLQDLASQAVSVQESTLQVAYVQDPVDQKTLLQESPSQISTLQGAALQIEVVSEETRNIEDTQNLKMAKDSDDTQGQDSRQRLLMKALSGQEIRLKFSYKDMQNTLDIDPYVFLLDKNGCVLKEEDFIFFGNPISICGSVKVLDEEENKDVLIQLDKVPQDIENIAVCYAIYEETSQENFSKVIRPTLTVFADNKEKLCYTVCDLENEKAIVFIELYRYQNTWKVQCIGAGYEGGISKLCESYGIQIV